MVKKVLVIDNYDSFTHNIVQILGEYPGCRCKVVKNDELTDRMFRGFPKIVLSPGPGVPSGAGSVLKYLRKYHKSKSIIGICLGHQAICEAFGGKLIQLPCVVHGIKKKISILGTGDYLFGGLPRQIEVGLYHSWAVEIGSLPECLSLLSVSSDGIVMAIAHKKYDIRGIQFHPESVMTKHGKQILWNWLKH